MGQSWSRSRTHPSREQRDGDLEKSLPHEQDPVSIQDLHPLSEFSGPRKRHASLSAVHYARLEEAKKKEIYDRETSALDEEYAKLCVDHDEKIKVFKDAIQPHTDEGGDAYYIKDAYSHINPVFAEEWKVEKPGPYLRYVKHLGSTWKHLEYLGHWMEVTCAPPKWKFFRHKWNAESREKRAKRTRVQVIDYTDGAFESSKEYDDAPTLRSDLDACKQTKESRQARLIIVEDLSRDLVENLGEYYDIDPLFFASHIDDYLFHNTRDRWVSLPALDVDARQMSHVCISYLRARYFETEDDFTKAEYHSGMFNVLRRIDSDRSRKRLQNSLLDLDGASVALSRAKTSLWIKPRQDGDPVTAILLVDPTVETGQPLWGGYRPFKSTPSMKDWQQDEPFDAPERRNLFEDVVYWSKRITSDDLQMIQTDPRCIAVPMYKLVIADWLTVLKYMTTMLGKIEWEFEQPHWGGDPKDIDTLLKKLSPWRRNVGYYETMISEAIARLFPPGVRAPLHASATNGIGADPSVDLSSLWAYNRNNDAGVRALWTDFRNLKLQMDEIQARIKSIEQTATNAINIEESRRAVKQNKNLARLTFLATIFIPLNFTSSFLSISPDFSKARTSIWLFFAIGVPLTLLAILVVDLSHPAKNGFLMKKWRKLQGKPERYEDNPANRAKKVSAASKTKRPSTKTTAVPQSPGRPKLETHKTIPWSTAFRRTMTSNAKSG